MKKKIVKSIVNNILFPLLTLGLLIALWAILSLAYGNPFVIPQPVATFSRFFQLYKTESFWASIGYTVMRSVLSFIFSFVFAYATALLASKSILLKKMLSTVVAILRAAPTVAVILISYAFLNSDTMSVIVGFLIAFPILYASVLSAIEGIEPNLFKMARVYRVKKISVFFHVFFLSVSGQVFDVSRSTLSLCLKVVIAAEILTSVTRSVGGEIQTAYASFDINYLLAWTILAIVLSFAAEIFVFLLKKCVVRWEK